MDIGVAAAIDPSAEGALKEVVDLAGGVGPDKAIDCSGVAAAQRLAIDATRRRGQVSFVGESGELPVKISQDLIRKGLTLHGVWHWNLCDTPRMMQTIAAAGAMLDKVITHTFPMSRVADAWELQMTHQCGKVLLYPWK